MKYELMALVNSIARQENANGSDELASSFDGLYDVLSSRKETAITPINVGQEIFDIYFDFMTDNYEFRKLAPAEEKESGEYKKPFFVDPDLLEQQAMEKTAKASTNEYEDFILDLMTMLNIRQPRNGFQQNMKNYMALIKRAIIELQKENSDTGWLLNPDHMGK